VTRLGVGSTFLEFYYICPTNAKYILKLSVFYSTATCFGVYTFLMESLIMYAKVTILINCKT